MNNTMQRSQPPHGALIRVSGADCDAFLQGQLSHDMRSLRPESACLSSVNSPKGRVIATLVVCRLGADVGLLVAPDIAETLCQRLRMFVLRSKVSLEVDRDTTVTGWIATTTEADEHGANDWQCQAMGDALWLRAPGARPRWWCIGPTPEDAPSDVDDQAFALADIACGLPCIGQVQSDAHIAQHLGLQRFDALSFSKGCFTGQEVIARLHYRGGINRTAVRLRGAQQPPPPGTVITDGDGKTLAEVVNSAACAAGHEALAVWRGADAPVCIDTREAHWDVIDFDPPRPA